MANNTTKKNKKIIDKVTFGDLLKSSNIFIPYKTTNIYKNTTISIFIKMSPYF
jgi:hypothetical protein